MKASMSFKHKNGDGVLQKFIFLTRILTSYQVEFGYAKIMLLLGGGL